MQCRSSHGCMRPWPTSLDKRLNNGGESRSAERLALEAGSKGVSKSLLHFPYIKESNHEILPRLSPTLGSTAQVLKAPQPTHTLHSLHQNLIMYMDRVLPHFGKRSHEDLPYMTLCCVWMCVYACGSDSEMNLHSFILVIVIHNEL